MYKKSRFYSLGNFAVELSLGWDFQILLLQLFKIHDTLLTCQTPTMALAIRISKITKGSTKAVIVSSPSSNQANTYRKKNKVMSQQIPFDLIKYFTFKTPSGYFKTS